MKQPLKENGGLPASILWTLAIVAGVSVANIYYIQPLLNMIRHELGRSEMCIRDSLYIGGPRKENPRQASRSTGNIQSERIFLHQNDFNARNERILYIRRSDMFAVFHIRQHFHFIIYIRSHPFLIFLYACLLYTSICV